MSRANRNWKKETYELRGERPLRKYSRETSAGYHHTLDTHSERRGNAHAERLTSVAYSDRSCRLFLERNASVAAGTFLHNNNKNDDDKILRSPLGIHMHRIIRTKTIYTSTFIHL